MFTQSTSLPSESFPSRQTAAAFTRPTQAHEIRDAGAGRGDMTAPRHPAPANSDDWTRECLFDCYND